MITRMQDINRPECEKRPIKFLTGFEPKLDMGKGAKANGAMVQCPFCNAKMSVLRNHLAQSGKRCECGALAFKNFFYFVESGPLRIKASHPWQKIVNDLMADYDSLRALAHEIELSFQVYVEHSHLSYILSKEWTEYSEPRWGLGDALLKMHALQQKKLAKCKLNPGNLRRFEDCTKSFVQTQSFGGFPKEPASPELAKQISEALLNKRREFTDQLLAHQKAIFDELPFTKATTPEFTYERVKPAAERLTRVDFQVNIPPNISIMPDVRREIKRANEQFERDTQRMMEGYDGFVAADPGAKKK